MIPFLVGERVILRPLVMADADGDYPFWFNDAEVCQANSHHVRPYTREQAQEYIAYANSTDKDLVLAIECKATSLHIGNVALQNIHPVYRSADFAIVIGNKEYWGQGYGMEAATMIIRHGFCELDLVRIACATFENNAGMINLAHEIGMIEEGVRRNAAYKNGKHYHVIEYGLLYWEWDGYVLERNGVDER